MDNVDLRPRQRRSVVLSVRMTTAEADRLAARAHLLKLSVSAMARRELTRDRLWRLNRKHATENNYTAIFPAPASPQREGSDE